MTEQSSKSRHLPNALGMRVEPKQKNVLQATRLYRRHFPFSQEKLVVSCISRFLKVLPGRYKDVESARSLVVTCE